MSIYSDAIKYEEIVQALYQALLLNEGYDNIQVKHNIILQGRSGATAQFDVFWEFKRAGVQHRVAIECKNYNHSVEVGEVREFSHKLQDVGNLIGIMVTRKGYQDGAIKTARDSGIYLKKFQLPNDMNWKDQIRTVTITIHVLTLENIKRKFIPEKQWVKNCIKENSKELLVKTVSGFNDKIYLVDEQGAIMKSLLELDNELPRGDEAAIAQRHSFPMEGKVSLRVPSYPDIKLSSIEYEYDICEATEELSMSADAILQGLLSDIDGQESFLFFIDNTIRRC